MLFSSKNKKDRVDLILDIQSSVVRGALMLIRPGAIPHILWTESIDIPYRAQGGSAYLIKMAIRAIEDIALAAHAYVRDTHGKETLPTRITSVHCGLSSPWIVSRARTVSQEFSKETTVTKNRIADIIRTERRDLAGGDEKGLISIEEKIFDVRLNGYSILEWEGNTAKSLEISFAISLAGTRMIDCFKDAARRASPHEETRFHSSLLLQYTGVSLALTINDPYMLVHIHGELTDLVIADGHSCILFGSHPVGVRTVVRKIAHALKISDIAADSLLTLHQGGKLDPEHYQSARKVIADVAFGWQSECAKLIALIPPGRVPSMSIILSRTHQDFFGNAMKETPLGMRVRALSADEFGSHVSFEPHAERLRTTVLYAIAITNLETL